MPSWDKQSSRVGRLRVLTVVLLLCDTLRAAGTTIDVLRPPDHVRVIAETFTVDTADSMMMRVTFDKNEHGLAVHLSAPENEVKTIELRWNGTVDPATRCLGDAWERAYADMEWKPLEKSGPMPWYFIAMFNGHIDGYGVMTGPAAMCHWVAAKDSLTLIADVRSGGKGVKLGDRKLDVCTVVSGAGKDQQEPFSVAQDFCRQMCPHPRLPKLPIYGYNDWDSCYGKNTAVHFLRDAAALAALCPDGPNRPYMVVDDGWQANRQGDKPDGNPWDRTNAKFGSTMADLAAGVRKMNARPGLWYRPLEAWKSAPPAERLSRASGTFDPSVPSVRARIVQDMKRFREWGFDFVKFDFSTFELLGRWGNKMTPEVTNDGWAFADRTRTTAEIVLDFYHALREGGGDETTIDACNAVTHLSAGLFETARIGDDTSGEKWDRTWNYGVNALAFRAAQQNAFYAVDPDMAGLAKADAVPWEKNKQWVDLLSHSGTVFFASWKVDLMDDPTRAALREAFRAAAEPRAVAQPIDWLDSRTPSKWRLDGNREVTYRWE